MELSLEKIHKAIHELQEKWKAGAEQGKEMLFKNMGAIEAGNAIFNVLSQPEPESSTQEEAPEPPKAKKPRKPRAKKKAEQPAPPPAPVEDDLPDTNLVHPSQQPGVAIDPATGQQVPPPEYPPAPEVHAAGVEYDWDEEAQQFRPRPQ